VFDESFLMRNRDEWCRLFERDGITHAPISTVHDLPHDAQLLASGVIVPFADGSGMTVSSPIELGAAARVAPVPAPTKVGQHTEAVLLGSGYSIEEIESLRRLGVLAG
jgi:formyl-CoA transferase